MKWLKNRDGYVILYIIEWRKFNYYSLLSGQFKNFCLVWKENKKLIKI